MAQGRCCKTCALALMLVNLFWFTRPRLPYTSVLYAGTLAH
jgi:hypothetical protein